MSAIFYFFFVWFAKISKKNNKRKRMSQRFSQDKNCCIYPWAVKFRTITNEYLFIISHKINPILSRYFDNDVLDEFGFEMEDYQDLQVFASDHGSR